MSRLDAEPPAPAHRGQGTRLMFSAWLAAACLAIGCAWLGQLYLTVRGENVALRDQQMLTTMEVRGAQLQVEAERVISEASVKDTQKQLTRLQQELAKSQENLQQRESDLASMGQRIDGLTSASAEASRLLIAAREQIASLDEKLRMQGDAAHSEIARLAPTAANAPQALAMAVWNPQAQQGVLAVAKLPVLAGDKDYQLWVIDPAYPSPVDGGVFTVDPATGDARVNFRPDRRVSDAAKFAVSVERKGGAKTAEGPIVLLGDSSVR